MSGLDSKPATGCMIAFLPTSSEWCKMELPHLTLVYAGKVERLSLTDINSLAKDAASLALLHRPFALRVSTQDIFGPPEEQVRVLRLKPTPELWAMRRFVEKWNKSEFTEFKPHATVGPDTVFLEFPPSVIMFDRIMVAWGEESMTFQMNNQY